MDKPPMRRRLIIDIKVEDVPANREADLMHVTTEAVLDVLEGFPAVDVEEECLCGLCVAPIEPERLDEDGEPWDGLCGACADRLALPDDSMMRSDGSPRVWS